MKSSSFSPCSAPRGSELLSQTPRGFHSLVQDVDDKIERDARYAGPQRAEARQQRSCSHARADIGILLSVTPTEGSAVSDDNTPDHHIPAADEPSIPELEADETVAPRPEEEIADALRAKPDLEDHSPQPGA